MKNVLKIVCLYGIMAVVGIVVLKKTGILKEIPIDIYDSEDLVIEEENAYPANSMSYSDGAWTITGDDPNIVFQDIGKYSYGIKVELSDKNENVNFALYYNTGNGFSQKEVTGLENCGEGVYYYKLRGNILEFRIDVEGAEIGTQIADMKITLYGGHDYFKKVAIRFLIFNIILVIVCSIHIFYDVLGNKSSMSVSVLKVIFFSVVISMTERTFFRVPLGTAVILLLFDVFIALACMFCKIDNASYDNSGNCLDEEIKND